MMKDKHFTEKQLRLTVTLATQRQLSIESSLSDVYNGHVLDYAGLACLPSTGYNFLLNTFSILVVEPQGPGRERLEKFLHRNGFRTVSTDRVEMPRLMRRFEPALAIVGPTMADLYSLDDLARRCRACNADIPMLLLPRESSEDLAIDALRAGFNGYLSYSSPDEQLDEEVRRCLSLSNCVVATGAPEAPEMVGGSRSIQKVKEYLSKVALTDCNILVTGETGTGKEVAAEFIHRNSKRKEHPLVAVNCAAIPDTLLESELFGYEQGAFTGAQSAKGGKLKAADGGTFFLDEIGDMSAYAQAKILRTIDKKEIQRLGGSATIPINVRIVAATNQQLENLVSEGTFRKDLFFRLNVARVHLPPLRERTEDIPALVDYHLRRLNATAGTRIQRLTPAAMACMTAYRWPGNIRELKNVLEIVCVHATSNEISADDLPSYLLAQGDNVNPSSEDEKEKLLSALTVTHWNKSRAAERLHWSRMTLYRKMAKYQVSHADAFSRD